MKWNLSRPPGIFLVGFMGSGKTTAGRLLARRLNWRFVDIDEEIEAAERVPIHEIFAARGEAEFRRIEAAALERVAGEIAAGWPAVVALGGGAFAYPGNAELMSAHGITIWLDVPLGVAWERVSAEEHRPLARSFATFSDLYARRQDAYSRAEYRVEAAGEPEVVLRRLLGLELFKGSETKE